MRILGKILGSIVILIVISFAGQIGKLVGNFSADNYEQGKKEGQVENLLNKIVNELNSKTPLMVDSTTQLDNSMNIGSKLLRYNYTLLHYTAEDISSGKAYLPLKENLKNRTCTSMKTLIKLGVTIEYAYYGKNGKAISIISVPPLLCSS